MITHHTSTILPYNMSPISTYHYSQHINHLNKKKIVYKSLFVFCFLNKKKNVPSFLHERVKCTQKYGCLRCYIRTCSVLFCALVNRWGLIQFQDAAINSTRFQTTDRWITVNALLDTFAALKVVVLNHIKLCSVE